MGDSVVVPPGYQAVVDRFHTLRLSSLATGAGTATQASQRVEVA
jgi:hypothetical protein